MNKVMLLGNLTRDPENKSVGQSNVCNFGVAVNRRWTKDGEKHEEVTFVDCAAWGKTGELIAQHFTKGKQILVEGRLKLDQWEKEGQKHSKLSVVVEAFYFVGAKEGGASSPATTGKQSPAKAANKKLAPAGMSGDNFDPDEPPFQ